MLRVFLAWDGMVVIKNRRSKRERDLILNFWLSISTAALIFIPCQSRQTLPRAQHARVVIFEFALFMHVLHFCSCVPSCSLDPTRRLNPWCLSPLHSLLPLDDPYESIMQWYWLVAQSVSQCSSWCRGWIMESALPKAHRQLCCTLVQHSTFE